MIFYRRLWNESPTSLWLLLPVRSPAYAAFRLSASTTVFWLLSDPLKFMIRLQRHYGHLIKRSFGKHIMYLNPDMFSCPPLCILTRVLVGLDRLGKFILPTSVTVFKHLTGHATHSPRLTLSFHNCILLAKMILTILFRIAQQHGHGSSRSACAQKIFTIEVLAKRRLGMTARLLKTMLVRIVGIILALWPYQTLAMRKYLTIRQVKVSDKNETKMNHLTTKNTEYE